MAGISAKMVQELRARTGAGIMDCKKALTETNGDFEAAVVYLREKGLAAAVKKAGRIAAEGLVDTYISDDRLAGSLVEVNCETDFVAKNEDFKKFVSAIAKQIVQSKALYVSSEDAPQGADPATILLNQPFIDDPTKNVETALKETIAKIGENMAIRRLARYEVEPGKHGVVESYIHMAGRVGVLVELAVDKEVSDRDALSRLAHELGMQIAAMKPQYVSREEVPQEVLDREREIYRNAALNEGRPEKIVDRIVEGKLGKFFEDVCLIEQTYVKDSNLTIKQLLQQKSKELGATISVVRFARFEKGEGIDKKEADFAEEIMAELNR